jgi:uncharacterized membrane protein YedE/YeeE
MAAGGGLLIGIASVVLLAFKGRITGISGITWGAVSMDAPALWRWLFLAGLIAGGAVAHTVAGVPLPAASQLGTPAAILGGLVVGFGVKLANGCTSGHGVCGIGLASPYSMVATLTFMATGIATVFVMRHLLGLGA